MARLGRWSALLVIAAALVAPPRAEAAATLTARVSSAAVTVDGRLVVSGVTAPRALVVLAWRRAGRWRRLTRVRADLVGAYVLHAPTWWEGDRRLRITATDPRTGRSNTQLLGYVVRPAYRPAGTAAAFRRYPDERYWDPCRTITWKFNPEGGYAGSLATVRAAIRQVSQATGIRFAYRGRTDKVAFRDGAAAAHTRLLISWASPVQVPDLRGSVVGSALSLTGFDGYYKHAQLVLDRTEHLRPGFHTRGAADWGQVLLHELGHVMGLAHVRATDEVMHPDTTPQAHRYGAGDLAGLRAVGAGRPCP